MYNWEYLFSPEILERGMNYYYSKSVKSIEKTEKGYLAKVHGTEDYTVEITMNKDSVEQMHCNCPYAKRGARCKHMAAGLFRIKYREPDIRETGEDHRIVILNQPDYLSDEAMDVFYSLWLSEDDFYDEDDEIGWDEGLNYADEFRSILDRLIGGLIEEKKYMTAFYGLQKAFYLLNKVEMRGSLGEHDLIAERIEEYWRQVINLVSDEEREDMYRWFDRMEDDSHYILCIDTIERILNESFPDTRYRTARCKKLKHSVETETDEMCRSVKEEKYHRFLTQYGVNTDQ